MKRLEQVEKHPSFDITILTISTDSHQEIRDAVRPR